MAEGAGFYFRDDFTYDEKAARKFLKPETASLLQLLIERLEALTEFDAEAIGGIFEAIMEERELKLGKIAQPVRVALTGGTVSPGIFETIEALGREKTLERLKRALTSIQSTTLQDTHEEAGQES
jgi:glutamyl-tRNA synthetase